MSSRIYIQIAHLNGRLGWGNIYQEMHGIVHPKKILANVKKYMKEASGLDPKVQRELAEKRATQDLIKKYGKGIIPLLTQLKNR